MRIQSKADRALAPSFAVRPVYRSASVLVTIILFGLNAVPQSDSQRLGMSAKELVRRVVANELKSQADDHGHWMYRLEKEESGRKQVQEILETNNGSLTRLLSIDSRPLDAEQQQREPAYAEACKPSRGAAKITASEQQEGRTRGALVQSFA
jgi:hypothetical protein